MPFQDSWFSGSNNEQKRRLAELVNRHRGVGDTFDGDLVRALQQLNRKLRRRLYDLNSLFKISVEVAAIRDEQALLNAYLLNVMGLLGAEVGLVVLSPTTDDGSDLEPVMFRGLSSEEAGRLSVSLAQQPQDILDPGQPVRLGRDASDHMDQYFCRDAQAASVELIGALRHRGELLGYTLLGKPSQHASFSNAEIEMLGLLSNLFSVALVNARMYQRMEQMSQTDGLTGLYNHRQFQHLLRNEISRAKRFERPVSLALLDIDHFKSYNDTHGHPAGDALLRTFSNVLGESVRCTDFVARYGGEEFCAILPEVGREGAKSFCERVRQRIELQPFPNETTQPEGRITVSIGSATFPNDASTAEQLIACADAAMYEAKRMGRNRFVLFSSTTSLSPSGAAPSPPV